MTRLGRAAVLLFLGLTMGRLLWSDSFGWFVQQRMEIPLIIATVVLILLGIYEAVGGSAEELRDAEAAGRAAAPKVGWLMVLPLLVLVSVAPAGLGAAAADRVEAFTPIENESGFEPLPDTSGPLEMTVYNFVDRAAWDADRSLEDKVVRLEGLVVNDPAVPDGFLLTRFLVSCCAADGVPIQVGVRDVGTAYPNDTWVIVELTWRPPEIPYVDQPLEDRRVDADVVSLTIEPNPPKDAYESPY